ncbi:MAG: hypothetical protein F4X57_12940 [Chloroflexi bacterium]|nr:hypothetical protein [Chloroflexota bacterium]
MPTKKLRIAIWANGAVSILLALTMLLFWISLSKVPPNQHLFTAAFIISAICVTTIPVLGVCMVVMEILGRRDRSRNSAGGDDQAGSH